MGLGLAFGLENKKKNQKKIKGTTKPLKVNWTQDGAVIYQRFTHLPGGVRYKLHASVFTYLNSSMITNFRILVGTTGRNRSGRCKNSSCVLGCLPQRLVNCNNIPQSLQSLTPPGSVQLGPFSGLTSSREHYVIVIDRSRGV